MYGLDGCNLTCSSDRLVALLGLAGSYLRKILVTNMQRDSGIVSLGVIHMDHIGWWCKEDIRFRCYENYTPLITVLEVWVASPVERNSSTVSDTSLIIKALFMKAICRRIDNRTLLETDGKTIRGSVNPDVSTKAIYDCQLLCCLPLYADFDENKNAPNITGHVVQPVLHVRSKWYWRPSRCLRRREWHSGSHVQGQIWGTSVSRCSSLMLW